MKPRRVDQIQQVGEQRFFDLDVFRCPLDSA